MLPEKITPPLHSADRAGATYQIGAVTLFEVADAIDFPASMATPIFRTALSLEER